MAGPAISHRRRGMLAAAAVGTALGVTLLASGALLLYTGEGVLGSAGFLMALTLGSLAAGVWVASPRGKGAGGGAAEGAAVAAGVAADENEGEGEAASARPTGRWMLAIGALVVTSFTAMAWLRYPALQLSVLGPPLALVFLMAEPAYALGALLAALDRGPMRGGVAVPALLGAAVGVLAAGFWLVPMLPPGPVFLGAALLLTGAGSLDLKVEKGAGTGGGDSAPTDDASPASAPDLTGRVVLVTGVGGRGQLGYALTRAFLDRGARVVMVGRSGELEAYERELGDDTASVRADLSTAEGAAAAVAAALERWGRLDAVVNAVGGLRVIRRVADTGPDEWDDEIRRNARTAFLVSRAALPSLRESRGAIVNFASPAVPTGARNLGAYLAGKAAVVALTRTLALEEKDAGVRVNAIAPGMIDTESNRASMEDPSSVDWVTREEVAEAALRLAAPESPATGRVATGRVATGRVVTGRVVTVDGGGG